MLNKRYKGPTPRSRGISIKRRRLKKELLNSLDTFSPSEDMRAVKPVGVMEVIETSRNITLNIYRHTLLSLEDNLANRKLIPTVNGTEINKARMVFSILILVTSSINIF